MKSIFQIFQDQLSTKELWRRVCDFARFKRYENYHEWKKGATRRITREDVPALVIALMLSSGIIVVLVIFFKERWTYACFGLVGLARIIQSLFEKFQKSRGEKPE